MTAVVHDVADEGSLVALLRARPARHLRLLGGGSRDDRRPPPPPDCAPVRLRGLDRIVRLDAEDLTCSVEPGLPRAALDEALRPHGLELPLAGEGTLGGLFAADPLGPMAPRGGEPRSVLLGLHGVLADGTAFRSGAQVVKSVAGFDVHKLFVGSQGRLFAATRLHLRLRPRPAATHAFALPGLDAAPALTQRRELLQLAVPPVRLTLQRTAAGYTLHGAIAGRASFVAAQQARFRLPAATAAPPDHLQALAGREVIAGAVRGSRLPALLAALPADAELLVHGGGRFEVALAPTAADALLLALPGLDAHGAIVAGAPARRGRGTARDPGAQQLEDRVRKAFDPEGVWQ